MHGIGLLHMQTVCLSARLQLHAAADATMAVHSALRVLCSTFKWHFLLHAYLKPGLQHADWVVRALAGRSTAIDCSCV